MTGLVEAVEAVGAERVFFARALEPSIRTTLAARGGVELPFVRGRTVVPAGLGTGDLVVAGHPNHLGVFDLPAGRWLAVTGRWSALCEAEGAVATAATEPAVGRQVAADLLDAAHDLAKRAGQLPGATVAFPVESPVVVVLLSADPAPVAAAVPGASVLDGFAELPGGLRIEVEAADIEGYASAMERAVAGAS